MYSSTPRTTKTPPIPHLPRRVPLRRGFPVLLLALALGSFAPLHTATAADGGLPNNNTAEGTGALHSVTTGFDNTATGFDALFSDTTGQANTATGSKALSSNTTGISNTATGWEALANNTIGDGNTATGIAALLLNTTGNGNTGTGDQALIENTTGDSNTADGVGALLRNTTGGSNTAIGAGALSFNTAGNNNIVLGVSAGSNLTTGSNNIDIGAAGVAGESAKIRIGKQGTQNGTFIAGIAGVPVTGSTVVVNTNGKLGVAASSARFKQAIKPMDKASEAILALKPVTFHYKEEIDPNGVPQFGLVAEQVEKINPDLVVRDAEGKAYTVRYDAVNAMLLNEFLKEHRNVTEQQSTIAELKTTVAQQQKKIEALTSTMRKVSERVELSAPAPQIAANDD